MVDPPAPVHLDDAALARTIAAGGADGVEAEHVLCARMLPRMRLYLARHQRDAFAVEDAAQDAIIALLEGIRAGRLDDPQKVAGYALGICRNKSLEVVRRDQRLHRALLRSDREEVAEMAPMRLRIGRLEECLHRLRERDRALLRLVFVDGHTSSTTGAELGVSPEAVRVRRHRVITQLRECLGVDRYEAQR